MKIYFTQAYVTPGVEFPFTWRMQGYLSDRISALVKPSARYIERYGKGFDLSFYVSAKQRIKDTEIRGPGVFKKTKDVEYTLFLPFDAIRRKRQVLPAALQYLLQAVRDVLKDLDVDTAKFVKQQDVWIDHICADPRMCYDEFESVGRKLVLEQHNGPKLREPSWAAVEAALRGVDPRERGYFILSRPGAGYVQAAGARLRMICEWRQQLWPRRFRHVVLGRPGRDEKLTSINTCIGIVTLQVNEILTLDGVVAIFRSYYDTGTIPPPFTCRDDTARFAARRRRKKRK